MFRAGQDIYGINILSGLSKECSAGDTPGEAMITVSQEVMGMLSRRRGDGRTRGSSFQMCEEGLLTSGLLITHGRLNICISFSQRPF